MMMMLSPKLEVLSVMLLLSQFPTVETMYNLLPLAAGSAMNQALKKCLLNE